MKSIKNIKRLCLILAILVFPGCGMTFSNGSSGEIYFAGIGRRAAMDAHVQRVSLISDSEYFPEIKSIGSGWLALPNKESRPNHFMPSKFTFRWGDNLENVAIFKPREQLPKEIVENLSIDTGFHLRTIYSVHMDFRVENGRAVCEWTAPRWDDVTKRVGEGRIYPLEQIE